MTDIIKQAVASTKSKIPDHFKTLLGERPAGSQWGRWFTEDDFDLPWVEAEPPAGTARPDCFYFRLDEKALRAAFPGATLGAMPFKDVPADLLSSLRVEQGAHGPELRVTVAPDAPFDGVEEAWLILGDHGGDLVVFTAHPGPVMEPLPKDGLDLVTLGDLTNVAVKVERG